MAHTVLFVAFVSAFREGFAHVLWKFSSARFGVNLLLIGSLLPVAVVGREIASVGLFGEGSFAVGVAHLHSGVPVGPVCSHGLLVLIQNLIVFHRLGEGCLRQVFLIFIEQLRASCVGHSRDGAVL